MRRILFAVAAFALTGAVVVSAEDPKPAQPAQPAPKAVQPKALQPALQPRPIVVAPAKIALLEEEVETLEAQREVKKAYVKAAEVGVRAAEVGVARVKGLFDKGTITREELDKTVVAVDMAKAQLEIRLAEMKEVEVKVKHAKKRLEDAKAAGVRPVPGVKPVPVDPTPNVRFIADEKVIAELKAKIVQLTAEAAQVAADSAKADAELKLAETELARIQKVAMLGRVKAGTIEAAEAKVQESKDKLEKLGKKLKAVDASLADLQAKLKEIEK